VAILSGDLKLVESQTMEDVPEGGGGPTANVVVDGASNNIFPDISELDRAGGRVNLRKVVVHVQTDNRDTFLGGNFIVAEPPNDPNVSITVFSTGETFDQRSDAADRIEQYLVKGPTWNGYLLENHVAGQRSIQLFQRPGVAPPAIGRTLALVYHEDLVDEVVQYVRVTNVESTTGRYSDSLSQQYGDFDAVVVTCDISDSLRTAFAGSPPSRYYTAAAGKSLVRDTTVADAGSYHGVVPLTTSAALGDTSVAVESVYTQLVPSARTETIAVDQRPGGQRSLVLATSPRLIEVGVTPHSLRIRVGQENRGFSWVQILKPLPAPNTLVISYRALGTWYTVQDDGAGVLTGAGVGTVNYTNGSVALTTPALPDVGSTIVYSWGERTAFTSRSGGVGYRTPEFAWALTHKSIKPTTVSIAWQSGGVTKSVTDNGTGSLTGDGFGEINYATGEVFLRPAHMIDAGGEFSSTYTYTNQETRHFTGLSPDAGGFVSIDLGEPVAARSVTVRWVTVRNVSSSSGSTEAVTQTVTSSNFSIVGKGTAGGYYLYANGVEAGGQFEPGANVEFKVGVPAPANNGTYTWEIFSARRVDTGASVATNTILGSGATSGTVEVTSHTGTGAEVACWGKFTVTLAALTEKVQFSVRVKNGADTIVAIADKILVFPTPDVSVVYPPAPADVLRSTDGVYASPGMRLGGVRHDTGVSVYVACLPLYDTTYGWCYDQPAYGGVGQVWTAEELTAGSKTMTSERGVSTAYALWT